MTIEQVSVSEKAEVKPEAEGINFEQSVDSMLEPDIPASASPEMYKFLMQNSMAMKKLSKTIDTFKAKVIEYLEQVEDNINIVQDNVKSVANSLNSVISAFNEMVTTINALSSTVNGLVSNQQILITELSSLNQRVGTLESYH